MRQYVEGAMAAVTIPVPASNPMVLYFIAQLLQCEMPLEVANFYHRDPAVCDWYYQAYTSGAPGRPNSVANILRTNRHEEITGDVFILKTGPLNGIWRWSPDILVRPLAETLWWYRQSGRDITAVFGERGLVRMLGRDFA